MNQNSHCIWIKKRGLAKTGRGFRTRFREHQLDFAELGINIKVTHLKTVEGKAAARALERQYIQHYERALGARPRYNLSYH